MTWVEEKASGRIAWKKRLIGDLVEKMKPDDVLIVSELSRLGRSMMECMEILAVAAEKHIRIYAVKGNWQLDNLFQSKIVAMACMIQGYR